MSYRIRTARKTHKNGHISNFYFICKPNIPDFYSSLFIANRSKNSLQYGKRVGYILIKFFNFLQDRGVEYWNATDEDVKAYMLYIINFNTNTGEISGEPSMGYESIIRHKQTIVRFYKFLWQFSDHSVLQINSWEEGKLLEYKTALRLKWNAVESISDATIDLFLTKFKTTDKEYIMEYTDYEIQAIYSNFTNYRNRSIFLLTLHGLRIDEVLSVKMRDYNPTEGTVKPSRSKGTGRGRKRTIAIGDQTASVIENYIHHERNTAELKANKSNDALFVNTRNIEGEVAFTEYAAASFRSALKTAAKKAGIEGNVRTHSGRSNKATKLVKAMVSGDLNLTDETIRHIMGWKTIDSIKPYVDHASAEIAQEFAKEHAKDLNRRLLELQGKLDG
ncbi:tyrosine-type recombinase/integrase [Sulfurovum sp. zt1-1]|uniref:Tyrosine-type recombinase/integrase n=1 Tax=Sulfurovum zhangzhouensis TaxID=3019067 RepID=A0ABT7QWI6_9BACT|nr:site-specific integrase [Sulfurovum zhangzhouensis]MDM5271204.1 tyrosine-type recombinase/integrase [Sulfurovum zhangzhouensis]